MNEDRGLAPIELLVALLIVGLLAATAVPRFGALRRRSRQAEARANLIAMFRAERAFKAEKNRFSVLIHEIGFAPERRNRYAYFAGVAGFLEGRAKAVADSHPEDTGVEFDSFRHHGKPFGVWINTYPPASPCGGHVAGISGDTWTGFAQGQIDDDPALDLWSIATYDRQGKGPGCDQRGPNKAGHPQNERNDLVR
jgi:type IV pilus assembly protein PilA